jgi:exopolysaccharide biosynthesis operon protein EpsL
LSPVLAMKNLMRASGVLAFIGCTAAGQGALAATVYDTKDQLDLALATPDETTVAQRMDRLSLLAAEDFSYDDNIYRVPSSLTDLASLPGIQGTPRRQDYINSVSGGLSGEWLAGNYQSFDLDLRADDNRYIHNTDLNNISTFDRGAWNWGIGSLLSGELGAAYTQSLGGFINTGVYSKDVVAKTDYFGSARYQAGPRWGLFGGFMEERFKLDNPEETYNDNHSAAVDVGVEYATSATNTVGVDYRYTDARYPATSVLNGVAVAPDFTEDRARILLNYVPTDKTSVLASLGYLRRSYSNSSVGGFSGEIWRVTFQWQATDKTELILGTWRQLTADLTSQTDFYVSRGVIINPVWAPSEKIRLSLIASYEDQDYLGTNPFGVNPVLDDLTQARRDKITSESAVFAYTPIRAVTLSFSAAHENRDSNSAQFDYKDVRAEANVTYKFFRYGDNPP